MRSSNYLRTCADSQHRETRKSTRRITNYDFFLKFKYYANRVAVFIWSRIKIQLKGEGKKFMNDRGTIGGSRKFLEEIETYI